MKLCLFILFSSARMLVVMALISACSISTLAGTIRHDVDDSYYRALAQEARYESVGNVQWYENGSLFWGSGTLIHPEWVLTGGHIVDGTDFAGGGISSMVFEIGDNQLFPDQTVTADQWFPYQGWTASSGNLNMGFDIGLIHLSQPVTSIEPATLYRGNDEKGQTATFVGYGRTGTGLTGDTQANVFKRAGNQIIDNFGSETTSTGITLLGSSRIFYTDFDNPDNSNESKMGSSTPLPLEFMTANGDSGGGIFIEDPDTGETVLAGVHSFGSTFDGNNNSDYGDASGSTRVSIFVPWIEQFVTFINPIEGDLDSDGFVGLDDLDIVLSNWNQNVPPGDVDADPTNDGYVGLDDLDVVLGNWNAGTPPTNSASIPEPGTLLAMLVGAAALIKRR